jgi:chemotaxis protein histidine kinase CheA
VPPLSRSAASLPRADVAAVRSLEERLREELLSRRQLLAAYADRNAQVKRLTVQLDAACRELDVQRTCTAAEQARTAVACGEAAALRGRLQAAEAEAEAAEAALARQLAQRLAQQVVLSAVRSQSAEEAATQETLERHAPHAAAAADDDKAEGSRSALPPLIPCPAGPPATPPPQQQPQREQRLRLPPTPDTASAGEQRKAVEDLAASLSAAGTHSHSSLLQHLELQRATDENAELRRQVAALEAALAESAAAAVGHANPQQRVQYLRRVREEAEGLRRRCNAALRERFQLEQCVRWAASGPLSGETSRPLCPALAIASFCSVGAVLPHNAQQPTDRQPECRAWQQDATLLAPIGKPCRYLAVQAGLPNAAHQRTAGTAGRRSAVATLPGSLADHAPRGGGGAGMSGGMVPAGLETSGSHNSLTSVISHGSSSAGSHREAADSSNRAILLRVAAILEGSSSEWE